MHARFFSGKVSRTFSHFMMVTAIAGGFASLASDAHAASVTITGSKFGSDGISTQFPKAWNDSGPNDVVNFWPSGLYDSIGRNTWRTQGDTVAGMVKSNFASYSVDWYFNGAESGDSIKFSVGALSFTETNQNNHLNSGNDPGFQKLGTTSGSGLNTAVLFTLTDLRTGSTVTNGANNDPDGSAMSLMLSYVKPIYDEDGNIIKWKTTKDATDWFAFGLNDNGSRDKDYDDYMGIGFLYGRDEVPGETPIPGAFPLMASVLGGYYLLRRRREARSKR
jgi:hypothetical protein